MSNYERRAICTNTEFQTREADGKLFIEGYFAVFGARYELWPGAYETVDRGAFDNTLKNDDIRALIDHETRLVLGRNKAGTLELHADDRGLFGKIEINQNDQDAMNLYERVKRHDVSQCSFGFDIIRQEYEDINNKTRFTLMEVRLYEVSVVTFPAYEETEVNARKADYENKKRQKREAWKMEMKRKIGKEN